MTYEVREGWIRGELPGPNGRVKVLVSPRDDMKPWTRLQKDPPNLCLHTTEGGTTLGERYKTWEFPPNFACGDGKIVQLFPLGFASEAVDTKDGFLLQVELAYRVADQAPEKVYLPPPSTLDPLVALTAFLHKEKRITTGLKRPNPDWPLALDRLPAAKDSYYRRTDGTWPKAGVYGHVELPDDEHYDPASFDYPTFFEMVQGVLDGGLTPEQERALARATVFLETLTTTLKDKDTGGKAGGDKASSAGAAQRVAATVLKLEAASGPSKGD
jgi:hypothetical protein